MAAGGVPVMAQQIGEAVGTFRRQGGGSLSLAVEAKRGVYHASGLVIE